MAHVTTEPRRRRRSPAEAEQEIIAAADRLLRERPFRELTVDEVMRATDLSRPSFYVYFRDRHHLLLSVVQRIESELLVPAVGWFDRPGTGDGPALVREALRGVVDAYDRHGFVMRALADAAADDPGVEEVYGGLVGRFAEATAERIAAEVAAGLSTVRDPRATAEALILLGERYLYMTLGREPRTPVATVVETLATVWIRTIYLEDA